MVPPGLTDPPRLGVSKWDDRIGALTLKYTDFLALGVSPILRGALLFSSDGLVGTSRPESVVMNIVPFDLNPPRCFSFCNGAASPCETRLRYRRGYVAVRYVDKVDMRKICRKVQKSFPHFKLTDGIMSRP